jgi:hypothetical protein
VVATLDKPASPLSSAVSVRRRPVHGARHELMRLAGELRHMPEPRPRGVAMAERLLTEPSSPLYTASSSDEVARAARDAAASMCPCGALADDDAPRGHAIREASTALRSTPARVAEPSDHRFCMPTVALLPPQPPVDSADW